MDYSNRRASITHCEDNNEEKVDVGDVVKLEPKIFGKKGQWRILSSPNFIPSELSKRMALCIPRIGW